MSVSTKGHYLYKLCKCSLRVTIFKIIRLLVLEKKIVYGLHGHGDNLGYVTGLQIFAPDNYFALIGQEKKRFKNNGQDIAPGQGQTTPWGQNPFQGILDIKFDFDCPSGFRGEEFRKWCTPEEGYTVS